MPLAPTVAATETLHMPPHLRTTVCKVLCPLAFHLAPWDHPQTIHIGHLRKAVNMPPKGFPATQMPAHTSNHPTTAKSATHVEVPARRKPLLS
jgi:hypothetical protein